MEKVQKHYLNNINPRYLALILFVISFSIFIPSLKNDFVWDDNPYVVNKLDILKLDRLQGHFVPKDDVSIGLKNYYRPVLLTSLSIDNEIWYGNPFGFHLTNLLLHSLSTVLVYFLILLLLREFKYSSSREKIAFLAALLFALHPVHVESVSFVMARSDLLCSVFLLSSVIFYILSGKSAYYLIPSALSMMMGVMSKEVGIVAPVLIFGFDLMRSGINRSRVLVFYVISFCILILYIILRSKTYVILPEFGSELNILESIYFILKAFIEAVCYYFYKLVFPFDFNAYVLEIPKTVYHLFAYLLIFLSLIFAVIYCISKKKLIYIFGLFWIVITLLPALFVPILYIKTSPYSDRFAYIPSVAFCLLAALLYYSLKNRLNFRYLNLIIIIPLITVYLFFIINEQRVWKNEVSLWAATVERSPNYLVPRMNYGFALVKFGKTETAIYELSKSFGNRISGTNKEKSAIAVNIATLYMQTGDYDNAKEYFDKALWYNREFLPDYYYNIGLISFIKWRRSLVLNKEDEILYEKTKRLLHKAHRKDINSDKTNLLLAEFYFYSADRQLAREFAQKVLESSKNSYLRAESRKRAKEIIKMLRNK